MKRSYLFLAVGALALSACTSESVLEDAVKSRNAIQFENVVDKLSRADLTSGNMDRFCVFGYYTTPYNTSVAVPVFENVLVKRQDNNTWKYIVTAAEATAENPEVEPRYWVPDAHYYFFAYNCGNVDKLGDDYGEFTMNMNNGFEPSDRVLIINNYLCDATHQHDLVYASNTGETEENPFAGILATKLGNPTVGLHFQHLLAKVQAQFTSKFPEGYEVTISDVSIQNIRSLGDYNPKANNGWQNVRRPEGEIPFVYLLNTYDTKVNPITTKRGEAAAQTNAAYVIPYQYKDSDVSLKFLINVKNKGENVFSSELTGKFNPNWTAGYTYTYNVEVSGDAANLQVIAFTTVVKDGQALDNWNPAPGETPNIIIDK